MFAWKHEANYIVKDVFVAFTERQDYGLRQHLVAKLAIRLKTPLLGDLFPGCSPTHYVRGESKRASLVQNVSKILLPLLNQSVLACVSR